jgi:hypothetical protein
LRVKRHQRVQIVPPPPPDERITVVSWTTSTSRSAQRPDVRRPASAIISSTVTASLRRKRVSRISPARSPPRRRTRKE